MVITFPHDRLASASSSSKADSDALNKMELTSVYALVAYAAYHRKISEDVVSQTVAQHFGVAAVDQLPRKSYDEVIKFLVDVQIDLLVN